MGCHLRVRRIPHFRAHTHADLPGEYVKYNDNDGHTEHEDEVHSSEWSCASPSTRCNALSAPPSQVASAFCFFTHHISGGMLVITDIQGVGTFYTDPQIHTIDGGGFGA